MYPPEFEYFQPQSLDDALALLGRYRGSAKVLAGGHSLIPMLKLRLIRPSYLIDLNQIRALRYIKMDGDSIKIGSLTTYHELETSQLIRRELPILSEAASVIGDRQVRSWGTIGGAISHCDPAGDLSSCMLALRAKIVARSQGGERVIETDRFYQDTFRSLLTSEEILTEVIVDLPKGEAGGTYLKLERRAGDFATVGVAVQLVLGDGKRCTYAGIGLTAVDSTNIRASKAESRLVGRELNDAIIDEASQAAAEDCKPIDDPLRGSSDYKRNMVKVFTKRAIKLAWARAHGNQ